MSYIRIYMVLVLSLVMKQGVFAQSVGRENKPNIVVFFVDDLGWQDMSEPFHTTKTAINKRFRTPHIEELAKVSTKFTNAYASSVCTPSRVSFLTGLNAAHHRVTNWTNPRQDRPTDAKDEFLDVPDWNYNGLSPISNIPHTVHATVLPQLLKDNGYYTIHIGKAHWASAGTPGADPLNLGFMVNIGGHSAGSSRSYYGKENFGNTTEQTNIQAVPHLNAYHGSTIFLTEALTLEARKALEGPIANKKPFFLHFSNYAVHTPIQADPRFVQKYIDDGLSEVEAAYASLVEGMDKSIGDIVDFLKEQGIYDNTVIVFVSDNGGLSLSPPRGGERHTQNLPLRAGKGSLYEGGIRVPLLIKDVEEQKRKNNDMPVMMEDLFPTILEMTGVDNKLLLNSIDGHSILPLLKGRVDKSWKERPLVWHYPNKWIPDDGPGINFFTAMRKGDFKLLYNMKNGAVELYNLKNDIGEKNNLALKQRQKTKELSDLLTERLKIWKAQMPINKNTNTKIPYPNEIY